MSEILVTGARGLLGSVLVPFLRSQGHRVTGCSRHQENRSADLTIYSQAEAVLNDLRPEFIINLAACTNIDECENSPQLAYLANVRVVENLVTWIKSESPHSHLVHLSTDHVYDGAGPHHEENVILVNSYAFSKYAGELAALSTQATILRTNFFGRSRCAGRTSFSDWLVQSLRQGSTITVFDDVYFTPLSMSRLATLIGITLPKRLPGIFNLGAVTGMSKADFAFHLAEILCLPTATMKRGSIKAASLRARRAEDMRMDSSRFQRAFEVTLPTLQEELQTLGTDYESAR
jgi:dTDP-4-dehydrorhamnose reductase